MSLDQWKMTGEVKDDLQSGNIGPICDYVPPPATQALAGLEQAAWQIIIMLCNTYPPPPIDIDAHGCGVYHPLIFGRKHTDALREFITTIWGELESSSLHNAHKIQE